MIEAAFDVDTIKGLKQAGIREGWRCLEIGGGAGSIALWMSEVVGATGSVVVIDKDISHLQALEGSGCEVIQGDFSELGFVGQFDLIHCRYVLIHNKNNLNMIRKIKGLLKNSGLVLLEEPDFTSALASNTSSGYRGEHVNQAICSMFSGLGLDPMYGLHLPDHLVKSGYDIVDLETRLHFCRGNSAVAKLMAESADALREKYIASGKANEDDIADYISHAENRKTWSIYYSTVSIMARIGDKACL